MPLSKLTDNLSEGIHNNTCINCKMNFVIRILINLSSY